VLVKSIEVLALDVDGVLTDGVVALTPDGAETKGIALRDLDALAAARRAGLRLALVSGESGQMLDAIARRIGVDCVVAGAKDKRAGLAQLCERLNVAAERVCFVGDADRDALAFDSVGLALAPADASTLALRRAGRVLRARGGRGAVAEVVELLLAARAPAIADAETAIARVLADSARAHQEMQERAAPALAAIASAFVEALRVGNKILLCGNGGSAADAQHVAAELVGRFSIDREPWPAIALTTDTSVLTAIGNDWDYREVFARQVRALARPGDLVVGISTSGKSANVVRALEAARDRRATTVAFVGMAGGTVADFSDLVFAAPATQTARIQELHLLGWHAICELVELSLVESPKVPTSP